MPRGIWPATSLERNKDRGLTEETSTGEGISEGPRRRDQSDQNSN